MTGAQKDANDALSREESITADAESVQIVKGGEVDEDELAALVAGIVAASAAVEPDEPEVSNGSSRWVQGARRAAQFPRNGRDAWRWSLR